MNEVLLEARNLKKSFGERTVLDGITIQIHKGEVAVVVGPSGCGKSTLFNLIAGLLTPTSGDVTIGGASVVNRPGQVGYMLQKDLLLPWRTIEDNITLGQTLRGVSRREALAQAAPLIRRCGLHGFEQSRPSQLSGGMRQRAALLRTLLTGKDVLLLDEPFGALDAITRLQLQLLLTDIWQELRKTILFVTHDVDEALLLSDEILLLTARPGRVLDRIAVKMPRPRTPAMLADPAVAAQKADIMALLWKEVGDHDQAE